jgi:hypothetical protein
VGIAYRIEPTLGLTVVVWHGRVTVQDSVDHLVQLAADSHWPPGQLHLTDVRTVTSVAFHASELLSLLLDESNLRDLENVVIVDAALLAGTTVQDAAASLGLTARPFADVAEACAHLRVDPAPVELTLAELREQVRARRRSAVTGARSRANRARFGRA